MAKITEIIIYHTTGSTDPTGGSLLNGELGYVEGTNKTFIGTSSGTAVTQIAGPFTLAGDTGTSPISPGDTLTIQGQAANGIDTSVSGDTLTIDLDLAEIAEKSGNLAGSDRLAGVSGTTEFSETISNIPLSIFNNDSNWDNYGDWNISSDSNTGDTNITSAETVTFAGGTNITTDWNGTTNTLTITGSVGSYSWIADADSGGTKTINSGETLDIAGGEGINTVLSGVSSPYTNTITLDLSELTDMTGAMVGTDEFIVLDASAQRRKAANEIPLSVFDTTAAVSYSGDWTITGDWSTTGGTLSVATPTADAHAATKAYVDGVAQGLDIKASVRIASTADIAGTYTATGGTSGRGQFTAMSNANIDGVVLAQGDRILLKDQTGSGAENGIWVITTLGTGSNGVWDRATDFDEDEEVTAGSFVFVEEGANNGDTGWVLTTNDPITIGGASGTSLTWAQFSGAGTYTASDGVTLDGSNFELDINSLVDTLITSSDYLAFEDVSGGLDKKETVSDMFGIMSINSLADTPVNFSADTDSTDGRFLAINTAGDGVVYTNQINGGTWT